MGVAVARLVRYERGSPAVIGIPSFRPVALRPRLSTGLPLSLRLKCQIVADRRQVRIVCRGSQVVSHIGDMVECGGLCSARGRCRIPESPRACEVMGIETMAEIAVSDREAAMRRVNEAAIARIDADVIDVVRVDAEENEISRRELCERYLMCGALLLQGGARNGEADLLMHVQSKSTAVEAGGVGTAELVSRPDQRGRCGRDGAPLRPGLCLRRLGRRRLWRRCADAAA